MCGMFNVGKKSKGLRVEGAFLAQAVNTPLPSPAHPSLCTLIEWPLDSSKKYIQIESSTVAEMLSTSVSGQRLDLIFFGRPVSRLGSIINDRLLI